MGFHRDSGPFSCGTSSTLVIVPLLVHRRLQEGGVEGGRGKGKPHHGMSA